MQSDNLRRATQRLREAIQALAQQAPGPQREQALRSAHKTQRELLQTCLASFARTLKLTLVTSASPGTLSLSR